MSRPTIITETHIDVLGAERVAPIVERRLDGRLLVADPGKSNAWLIFDGAEPPKAMMKALKGLAHDADIRIVVRKKERPEAVAEAIAVIEDFVTGGGLERAAKRAAAAEARSDTKVAEKKAAAKADRAAREAERIAAANAAFLRASEARRRAHEEAVARVAAANARADRARTHRECLPVADRPGIGHRFRADVGGRTVFVVAESYGRSWVDRSGDEVCYVYWRHETPADAEAPIFQARAPVPTVTMRVEHAPEVGAKLRLRDGTVGTVTAHCNRRHLSSSSEDVTSFYSSELWDCTVVDVEYAPE